VGHQVTEAADGGEALKLITQRVFDVVICDIRLPKIDGLTLLRRLQHESPSTVVILMTAFGRVADAKQALKEGAYDYVTKPFDPDRFPLELVGQIEEERALEHTLRQARTQLDEFDVSSSTSSIVGQAPSIVRLLRRIDTIAQSEAPVLINGES